MTAVERYAYDVLIIGGGAAGMAAALAARRRGYRRILIAERNKELGGVLLQCTHTGFGLGYYREDLTGIEYARRFRSLLRESGADIFTGTSVIRIFPDRSALLSGAGGVFQVAYRKCVLASGCREKTIWSQDVAGSRPAGIMTCGTAQKLINVDGLDVGNEIVIAGTGDVGQVMAGQLAASGVHVIAMIEKEDRPGGRRRNRERFLEAYDIPVVLRSVITRIVGSRRIEGVLVRNLDSGGETFLACDTLLTAIGMIPDRQLLEDCFPDSGVPDWVLPVGNCDYVHDVVDGVTLDGLRLETLL